MFGFLNIYKPKGMTSHDVVTVLRHVTKIKQIGHTGTLDPFAEGVLPVCIGKATRLIEYLNDEKAYVGTVQLGAATDTYDLEGKVVKKSEKKAVLEEISIALNKFRGEIEQLPPVYSALKINGKKLYEYARAGEDVEVKPRKVNLSKLEITNFDEKLQQLVLHIECSKGTYIRSVANDLGAELGTCGHLIKLVRVKAGDFLINDSIPLNSLDTDEKVRNSLIHPLKKLTYPKYELNETELKRVSNGMPLKAEQHFSDGKIVLLTYNNSLAAVAYFGDGFLKCKKVL